MTLLKQDMISSCLSLVSASMFHLFGLLIRSMSCLLVATQDITFIRGLYLENVLFLYFLFK